MAERMREIDIHRDMLRAEIKTANSEKQNSRYVCIYVYTYIYIHRYDIVITILQIYTPTL